MPPNRSSSKTLRWSADIEPAENQLIIMTKEELYNQGMEFFARNELDDAVASYQAALKQDPNYPDALHALAMTYAHLEKLDEAIEVAKRLIEVTPNDELAYTSLSIFYQQKGMIAEAEHVAAQARTLGWKRQLDEKKRS
jgi:tetratricopeptide (TPR) repeat protein